MFLKYRYSVNLAIIVLSVIFGVGSLILLNYFLFTGGTQWVHTGLNPLEKNLLNAFLCSLFFFQHSIMIRKTFKQWMGQFVPKAYQGAIYSIASGLVLTTLIVFWQPSHHYLIILPLWCRVLLHTLYISMGLIAVMALRSIPQVDVLGINPLVNTRGNVSEPSSINTPEFIARGPYRWIRHPIYMACILATWSTPHITPDRMMFNLLFTIWVCCVVHLEEKDLIDHFGDPYREYQAKVPIFIPRSLSPRV